MSYAYTTGDGVTVLDPATPDGAAEPVSILDDVVVSGNVGHVLPAGDWIYYARVTNGRIVNNTRTSTQTIGHAGSAVTEVNNN